MMFKTDKSLRKELREIRQEMIDINVSHLHLHRLYQVKCRVLGALLRHLGLRVIETKDDGRFVIEEREAAQEQEE